MQICRAGILGLILLLTVAEAPSARAQVKNPTPVAGSTMLAAGVPTGASPDANKNLYGLKVFYFNPMGNLKVTTVTIPGIAATAGLPTPTAAQAAAASAAKAQAIVNAINKANIAVQPVTINGVQYNTVMASVDANTVQSMYNTGKTMVQLIKGVPTTVPVLAPFNQTTYTVNGVRQSVINLGLVTPGQPTQKLGAAVYQTGKNTTGEVGDGEFAFTAGSSVGGGAGANGSTFQGAFGGLDASTDSSTGMDYSGNQSLVGFGFIDYSSAAPVDYIAAIDPTAGMTDDDVLGTLVALFDEDFASEGYTASYNPITDFLTIDQPLSGNDMLWSSDSDTGLYLDPSVNSLPVPKPSSFAMIASAVIVFGATGPRRWKARAERRTASS